MLKLDWRYCLILIFIVFFILWLFLGGKYDYIGIDFGSDTTDSSDYSEESSTEDENAAIALQHIGDYEIDSDAEDIYKNVSYINIHKQTFRDDISKPVFPKIKIDKRKENKKEEYVSNPEKETCKALERAFGKPFVRDRPDFLRNPLTGKNLELDCYNKELGIAAEYNGPQHYYYPNFTGQSYKEFQDQIARDNFKLDKCDENGVYLITVPYKVKNNIDFFIKEEKRVYEQKLKELEENSL